MTHVVAVNLTLIYDVKFEYFPYNNVFNVTAVKTLMTNKNCHSILINALVETILLLILCIYYPIIKLLSRFKY